MSTINQILKKDLYILDDETNPLGTNINKVLPSSILDQIYDDQDPTQKNLRTIIEELKKMIITGGDITINFPVTSVNGELGDVEITKDKIGLSDVDNTPDNVKPLSDPQRESVMKILNDYKFEIDMKDLYDHIQNGDNPHHVTASQINADGAITDMIDDAVSTHNESDKAHTDIREQINKILSDVENIESSVDFKLDKVKADTSLHYNDAAAHNELFIKKEDTSRKVPAITDENTDYDHYPSTRAVANYISSKIVEYMDAKGDSSVNEIVIVDNRESIPEASRSSYADFYLYISDLICEYNEKYGTPDIKLEDAEVVLNYSGSAVDDDISKVTFNIDENGTLWLDTPFGGKTAVDTDATNKVYFVVNGVNGTFEIARYKKNEDESYSIEYQDTHIYTHLNSNQFYYDANDGLSVNISDLGSTILEDETLRDKLNKIIEEIIGDNIGENYYTKDEIDSKHYITAIKIVRGTTHGTIRYYINDDLTTMSEDVPVAGLGKLAFLNSVNGDVLEDNCVNTNNIIGKAITKELIADKAVDHTKLSSSNMTVLGNVSSEDDTAEEIPIKQLAELFIPTFRDLLSEEFLTFVPESVIREIVRKEYRKISGIIDDPTSVIQFAIDGSDLAVDYDETYGTPELAIEDSNLKLSYEEDDPQIIDTAMSKFSFAIDEDGTLSTTVEDAKP